MRPALQSLLARPSSLSLLRPYIQCAPSAFLENYQQCQHLSSRLGCPPARASIHTESATFETSQIASQSNLRSPRPWKPPNQKPALRDFTDVDASDYKAIIDWLKEAQRLRNAPNVKGAARPTKNLLQHGWDALARLLATDSTNVEAVWRLLQDENTPPLPHPSNKYTPGSRLELTKTSATATLWTAFLEIAMMDASIMEEIRLNITNRHSKKRPFSSLYLLVVEHLLLNDQAAKAIHWYDILSHYEQVKPENLGRFLGGLILDTSGSVDPSALKEIYIRSGVGDAYQWIIPRLTNREAFYDALEWHMFLKEHGDHSPLESMSLPLKHYFLNIEEDGPHFAIRPASNAVSRTLQKRGSELEAAEQVVKMAAGPDGQPQGEGWIVHLLATKWVSLDISINSLHALGVHTLGYQSLQAVALREPNAADLVKRIDQLEQLGISIGKGAYPRAMATFARRGQEELLQGLLASDQHPGSFADPSQQRKLIQQHEAAGEWQQAKLLRAVQLAAAIDPVMERYNVQLRMGAIWRDLSRVIKTLEAMRIRRIPVEVANIWRILARVLRPRLPGHRANLLDTSFDMEDTELAISILKNIMAYGSYVPIKAWKEVTRRLGMAGRIDELHSLSAWLADAYNPRLLGVHGPGLAQVHVSSAAQLDPSHDLHPLRILFPDVAQRSIIEWSFIHGMTSFASGVRDNPEIAQMIPREELKARALKMVLGGVNFLKQLAQRGVYIKDSNVRRACYERLVIFYGPGVSGREYNRAARLYNPIRLGELASAMEQAWGKPLWRDLRELEDRVRNEKNWDAIPPRHEKEKRSLAWNENVFQLRDTDEVEGAEIT